MGGTSFPSFPAKGIYFFSCYLSLLFTLTNHMFLLCVVFVLLVYSLRTLLVIRVET